MNLDNTPITILVVDDHPLLREGLASMIKSQPGMTLVAEAGTGSEGVEKFAIHHPDVTLMDLRLPDINGVDAISKIRTIEPDARIIVLTTYLGDVQVARALTAGAYAFLLKASVRTELIDTIQAVHKGRKRIPLEVAAEMAEYAEGDSLTIREIEVLEQVAAGNENRIVADRLEITEDAVTTHMCDILSKLGANDRTHAVTIALRRGFLNM